jgi:hypothetical protein
MRRVLIAACAALSMLLLPAAAQAAPVWTTSTVTTSGTFTSGELVAVTVDIVNTGDTTGGTAGTLALSAGGAPITVEGTPTVSDGPGAGADQSGHVIVAAGSSEIDVDNAFGTGDARVVFQLRLPKRYVNSYQVGAYGYLSTNYFSASDTTARTVSKDGGAELLISNLTPIPRVATKDQPYSMRFRVTNKGTATAPFAALELSSVSGSSNALSPTPPSFTPTGTFVSGCASMIGTNYCIVADDLAPGASAEVEVRFEGLTHYGEVWAYVYGRSAERSEYSYGYGDFDVTDGGFSQSTVWMNGPTTASGNTDITYTGGIAALSGSPIGQSQLELTVTGVDAKGRETSDGDAVQGVKSIILSNGATCTKHTDGSTTYNNRWVCPIAGIAVGQRIEFSLIVNVPSPIQNLQIYAEASLDSVTGLSDPSDSAWTMLNVARTASLEATVSAPKLIGADRVAPVTVTAKNTGTEPLTYPGADIALAGSAAGFVDPVGSGCEARQLGDAAWCSSVVTLQPGESRSWTLRIRASKTLGTLVVAVSDLEWSTALDDTYGGHSRDIAAAAAIEVVKPSAVPLTGVKQAKIPARNVTQLVKLGLPSTITCPVRCKVTAQLRVSRAAAMRLRLIRKTKNTKGFVVIGTATRARAGAGKVIVTTKVAKRYQAAVGRLGVPLPLQRVAIVVSTHPDSRDARWTNTRAVTIKPKPKPKPRKPRR